MLQDMKEQHTRIRKTQKWGDKTQKESAIKEEIILEMKIKTRRNNEQINKKTPQEWMP